MSDQRRVTLITGASGGIGADLARVFARHGCDLALVARSAARLAALADEIAASGRPKPLVFVCDLSRPGAGAELVQAVAAQGACVETLINNAAFGLVGPAGELSAGEQVEMTDLNIRTLTELSLLFLPDLRATRGRILNVASVAAFLPGPGMAVYYATKAYVVSLSEALAAELKIEGIVVSVLCPGVTHTGFQVRAGVDAALVNKSPGMTARAVAEAGYAGLMAGRRRIVPGFTNKVLVALLPLVPNALLLPLTARLLMRRLARK